MTSVDHRDGITGNCTILTQAGTSLSPTAGVCQQDLNTSHDNLPCFRDRRMESHRAQLSPQLRSKHLTPAAATAGGVALPTLVVEAAASRGWAGLTSRVYHLQKCWTLGEALLPGPTIILRLHVTFHLLAITQDRGSPVLRRGRTEHRQQSLTRHHKFQAAARCNQCPQQPLWLTMLNSRRN